MMGFSQNPFICLKLFTLFSCKRDPVWENWVYRLFKVSRNASSSVL